MIYLTTENEKVHMIHYMPFDDEHGMGKPEEELLKTGYLVEEIPEYTLPLEKGKGAQLFYTPERGFWFEIIDVPLTPAMQQEEMAIQLSQQQEVIDQLLLLSLGV